MGLYVTEKYNTTRRNVRLYNTHIAMQWVSVKCKKRPTIVHASDTILRCRVLRMLHIRVQKV